MEEEEEEEEEGNGLGRTSGRRKEKKQKRSLIDRYMLSSSSAYIGRLLRPWRTFSS